MTVLPRVISNKSGRVAAIVLLVFAAFRETSGESMLACAPDAIDHDKCQVLSLKKTRRPIRLIARGSVRAAGAYREIPLADAPEASLSERASDVLQKQSGIQVNRAGAPGTQSLLGIRGSGPDQVEYFLEGMPLPKPYNAPLNLETLPLPLFQGVEIFPSFIPSHLPAANIGGAMNFRLREVRERDTEYLTQVTATTLLGNTVSAARLTATSLNYVNFEQSRNRYTYLNNNGTTENSADDQTLWRNNEDFSRIGYTGFNRLNLGSWKLAALVDVNHSERGLPGVENLPLFKVRKTDDRVSAAASAHTNFTQSQSMTFFTSLTLDRSETYDPNRELLFAVRDKALSPQAMAGATYAFRSETVDIGVHARAKYQTILLNDTRIAERGEGQGAVSAAYDRSLFRLAAQTSGTLGQDSAGDTAFYATPAKNFVQQGASFSGLVGVRPLHFWGIDQSAPDAETFLEIYGQASSAYRAPSLYERFGDNIFVTPSANLKSEQALTNAAGIRASFRCFGSFACSLRSEAWLTGARDYILFTQNSARTMIAVNASSAQIWGVENEAALNWPGRALLSLRYTYLDARDYGNIPYYQDKFLPLRPRHHAVGTLTLFYQDFRLISTVEYRGAVFRDRYNSYVYYLASKLLVDAGIDYIFDKGARHTLNFTVKNITDNRDVDLIGYTVPGRYFLVKWMAQW